MSKYASGVSGKEAVKSKTVIVIAGPTAVGKTALAVTLAQQLRTCVISADSRQCYREMSIGTAKPSAAELSAVRHYFIDSFSVTEHITAADFERLALGYLDEIFRCSNYAVVCGGTGLYIRALTEGLDEMPETDSLLAEEINDLYRHHGLEWLQETVRKEDPVFFAMAETNNPARMLRALIFKRSTGYSITTFRSGKKKERNFTVARYALQLPRPQLYHRINSRVDRMMKEGLLDEIHALSPYRHLKNLQTVGYTEMFDYLDGKYSLEEAVEKIKQHTRNYAKRQLTWFRKDKDYIWLNADDPEPLREIRLPEK